MVGVDRPRLLAPGRDAGRRGFRRTGGLRLFAPQDGEGEGGGTAPPELEAFCSLPEVWGSGVNRRLILRVHEAIAEAGHTEAVLWVLRDDPRARRFYASHGWEPDGAVTEEGPINGVVLPRMRYRRIF